MKKRHHLKNLILTAAIAAITLPTAAPMCLAAQSVHAEENTSISTTESSTDNFYITKNYIATEEEAIAQNKTWQGQYINATDITTVSAIELMTSGMLKPQTLNEQLFLDKITETNADSMAIGSKDDMQDKTIVFKLINYNDTGFDLYYQLDTTSGIWYQTLNTKPDDTNSIIHTDSSLFDNRAGTLFIRYGSTNVASFSTVEWLLQNNQINLSLSDIQEKTFVAEQNLDVVTNENARYGNPVNARNIIIYYRLFGSTWINTLTINNGISSEIDNDTLDAITQNNIYIPTNGSAGDKLCIYQMPVGSVCDYIGTYEYKTFEYTLKEDNEALPVGDGVYTIFNVSKNIYETICAIYDESKGYAMELLESPLFDHMDKDTMMTATENYRRMSRNGGGFNREDKQGYIAYDKPAVLNISDVEYTDIIIAKNSYASDKQNNMLVHLDNRNVSLTQKIKETNASMTKNMTANTPRLAYTIYDVYQNIPANTNPFIPCALASTNSLNYEYETGEHNGTDFLGQDKIDVYVQHDGNTFADYDHTRDDELSFISPYLNTQESNTPLTTASYVSAVADDIGQTGNVYTYTNVDGDINQDGIFNLTDIVMQQKYLHGQLDMTQYNIASYAAANLCKDENNNVFDLCLLKRLLLSQNQ